MTEPLTPERLAEIRSLQLGDWYAGSWVTREDDGDTFRAPAWELVHKESGDVLARLRDWAGPVALWAADAHDAIPELLAEVDRLRAEVNRLRWEVERPGVEAERRRVRDVLDTSAAEARADGCFEGEADIALKLREYEAKWAAEDAGRAE